ncbi:MAG: YkgJ family cysteine cluster protein [Deltaproteobacteria bacterium]
MELRRFVPSDVCLRCSGCCRFAEAHSAWGPFFLFEEICEATQTNLLPSCLFTHPDAARGRGAWINLVEGDGQYLCPCLAGDRHTCRIYDKRPFDCRLYPFLLVREKERFVLAVDEKCPYVQEMMGRTAFAEQVAYLADLFSGTEGRAFLRANPDIIQDYPSDYRVLHELARP